MIDSNAPVPATNADPLPGAHRTPRQERGGRRASDLQSRGTQRRYEGKNKPATLVRTCTPDTTRVCQAVDWASLALGAGEDVRTLADISPGVCALRDAVVRGVHVPAHVHSLVVICAHWAVQHAGAGRQLLRAARCRAHTVSGHNQQRELCDSEEASKQSVQTSNIATETNEEKLLGRFEQRKACKRISVRHQMRAPRCRYHTETDVTVSHHWRLK